MEYTILLADGTTGTINDNTLDGQSPLDFIGERVNVHVYDENGNPVEVEGVLADVLDG